jgi:fructosamine-3-kinase
MPSVLVKRSPAAPAGLFACEATGLQWLSGADGGVPCARVIEYDDASLTLERLAPMAERAAPQLDTSIREAVDAVISRCAAGDFDDDDPPARLHGDLWSGNVMWTPDGAVLIDPAAHGGHRETDLAMLTLFGCPHLDAVLDGYQEAHPLRDGWRERIGLHQLYPLLAHVALFGGNYVRQTDAAARGVLTLS